MSDDSLIYSPNGVGHYPGEDACAHDDGCENPGEWLVEFLVDGEGVSNAVEKYPYCDDHVAEYFGYHPAEEGVLADGGVNSVDSDAWLRELSDGLVMWMEGDASPTQIHAVMEFLIDKDMLNEVGEDFYEVFWDCYLSGESSQKAGKAEVSGE